MIPKSVIRLAATILVISFISACKKDKDEEPPADFNPVTAGSTWTYLTELGQSYTITATDRDTMAMGRSYRVYSSSNGINQYRTKSGSDYYRFGFLPGIPGDGFEELYLKENQELNGLWQATQTILVPGVPIPLVATLKYTIKEKGVTRTVAGKEFKNVIHVRMDVSVLTIGSVGGGDFYYAAGVGLIESAVTIVAQGQTIANTSEVLTAYSIK